MTEEDMKYRQGRSKERVEATERIQMYTIVGGTILITILFLFEAFMK